MPANTRELLSTVQLPTVLSPELRRSLEDCGQSHTFEAGTHLYHPGEKLTSFLVFCEGVVRVYKSSEDGREITLYHVGGDEVCTVNVLCMLTDRPAPASALVEDTVQAIVYSREHFMDWFVRHESMRELVLGHVAGRVHTMMALVEEVAFRKLDQRLAAYLLSASSTAPELPLAMTHEALAMELGSVREVVSRILKNFESGHLVSLGRGRITVLDRQGLRSVRG